ncbi:precorrin-3B C(17)-methyltransferase [Paenibacillus sp. P32E]|uniref:precorrin-3B C(17)-methyltransferase n=1 Tax=Paenibacillus sp. P32E TaxID=1349434 RepID=UPI000963088F|nr:hypothetical protein A3848_08890 [Paenibacillus sp. P32E]
MNKLGKLLIIGFGPGAMEHITGRALTVLEESEAVIGYSTYVDLIRPLLRHQEVVGTGMTEEVSRAQEAVRRAEAGQTIAVISSGDAGVYGMAGLVYEVLIERGWTPDTGVKVEVIPGISAIQSCSSLLGAPIMHDSCTISLSDHLTPWESIAARVEAAGAADFVIAFYNPRSGKRTRQIEEARQILLRYRDPATPVGIVKSAYRDRQQTIVTTLQDMLNHEIGMLSTVIVGNSATIVYEGLLVTPRGYGRKYSLGADTQVLKPHERLRTSAEPWSLAAALAGGEASTTGQTLAGPVLKVQAERETDAVNAGAVLNGGYPPEVNEPAAVGLNESPPGDYVKVKTCGFCDLRKEGARAAAERLFQQLNGRSTPRELQISVTGCGMACNSAVLEDIGLIYSKGSFELYLGGKKSGRAAHAGTRVREGMNEEEAIAAVTAVVEQYCAQGYPNERFYTFFERMGRGIAVNFTSSKSILHAEHKHLQNPESARRRTAVLLVGHGSRVEEGNEELRSFTSLLAARRPELTIETCFIELSAPSISEGIDQCVRGGAGKVYVVPIILFAAGHSKLDIPMALDQAKLIYPGVEFIYGRPIGVQERAVDILMDRIAGAMPLSRPIQASARRETAAVLSEEEVNVPDEDTIVLIMGRGGSDPDANSDLCKLTRMLWERTSYKSVEACFIAMAKPSLNAGLERCLALGARKIIVLPYLLFTGVLMKQFSETVNDFAEAHPEIEVEAGSYLGSHPLLSAMLLDRIDETIAGRTAANCDNCKYRDEASIHHHHHHHHCEEGHNHGSHGGEGHGCGHGHECGHGHHGGHHDHAQDHAQDHHVHNHETTVGVPATAAGEAADTLTPSDVSRDVLHPATAPKAR